MLIANPANIMEMAVDQDHILLVPFVLAIFLFFIFLLPVILFSVN